MSDVSEPDNEVDELQREISVSSYADMLHDDERNHLFNEAIKRNIRLLVKYCNPDGNRFFNCCDIGTGSGLLTMMMAREFAFLGYEHYHITSYESFRPMATCAREIMKINGMPWNHITIVPSSSREHSIQEHDKKYDLLVAELLDTELIGEGCLGTYRHAIENLCSPDCLFVPHGARIFIEPVASKDLFGRHAINNLRTASYSINQNHINFSITVPEHIENCPGMPEIDDMQVSKIASAGNHIKENVYTYCSVTKPQLAFEFQFNKIESLKLRDSVMLEFKVINEISQPPVVVMWWEIDMIDKTKHDGHCSADADFQFTTLSCAPTWARCRDYYGNDCDFSQRDKFFEKLYGREVWREHWIQGIYYFASVMETRQMVGMRKNSKFTVYAYHDSHSLWFDLKPSNDRLPASCTCGYHRELGRSRLSAMNNNKLDFWMEYIERKPIIPSELDEFQEINFTDLIEIKTQARLPIMTPTWINLVYHHRTTVELKAALVSFKNLNRICSKIGNCQGFDLSSLDEMLFKSREGMLEYHYLWEYDTEIIHKYQKDKIVCDTPEEFSEELRVRHEEGFQLYPKLDGRYSYSKRRDYLKSHAIVFYLRGRSRDQPKIKSCFETGFLCRPHDSWTKYHPQMIYFMCDHPDSDDFVRSPDNWIFNFVKVEDGASDVQYKLTWTKGRLCRNRMDLGRKCR